MRVWLFPEGRVVNEEWRSFDGDYEVSSFGRVRSRPRRRTKGGILRLHLNRYGYPEVKLGGKRTTLVHVMVATAFLGPRPAGKEVRHLDGDPTNNRPENLAWGTHLENVHDTIRHGRHRNRYTGPLEKERDG
jgi:hypothetical protein